MGGVYDEGLTVDLLAGGARAVARVTDSQVSLELSYAVVVEDRVYHAHALVHVKRISADTLARNYSRALLSSVLQRNQTCFVENRKMVNNF